LAGKKQKQSDKVRILIVDDHPVTRRGLAEVINMETDLEVCGQAEDAAAALVAIGKLKPDLAIIDVSLQGASGIELMKNVKLQYPTLPMLALSMHDESLYAERALKAGAKGYIMKHEAIEKVIGAIKRILKGEIYVSDNMTARMVNKLVGGGDSGTTGIESLTDRELEVFRLIGMGHGTRQIATELFLSVKTIESYRAHIKEKLALDSATELTQHAIQWVNSTNLG
jgi:DNA-binding NarL/FixJ family response regulator